MQRIIKLYNWKHMEEKCCIGWGVWVYMNIYSCTSPFNIFQPSPHYNPEIVITKHIGNVLREINLIERCKGLSRAVSNLILIRKNIESYFVCLSIISPTSEISFKLSLVGKWSFYLLHRIWPESFFHIYLSRNFVTLEKQNCITWYCLSVFYSVPSHCTYSR